MQGWSPELAIAVRRSRIAGRASAPIPEIKAEPPVVEPEPEPEPKRYRPWFGVIREINPDCPVQISEIQAIVAADYDVSRIDLLSERRDAMIVRPRQVAMYLCRTMTLCSLPLIARRFNRDHTTSLHAVRKITALIKTDPDLAARIESIKTRLTNA